MKQLNVSKYVRESGSSHGGSILLDTRSGHCFAMNSMARTLWQEWCRSGDFDAAVLLLARRHPDSPHDLIRRDARRLADELIGRGLLVAATPGTATRAATIQAQEASTGSFLTHPTLKPQTSTDKPPYGCPSTPGATAPHAAGQKIMAVSPIKTEGIRTARDVLAAALAPLGLLAALLLIRFPLCAVLHAVGWTTRTWCRREATPRQAAASLTAVQRAAQLYPGRAACLELSLATLAVLAFTGRRAVWCIGTADDPYRFHAWVEAQGVPVTPPDEYGNAAFRQVLSV